MHLKTLTIRGFKSFASATTMNLEPGITCVVGPNGSGKSNVVDALAWVMGEQGAKNLRGGQMADVIFAGTSQRAALGRAQVSLTIDNTDGVLPIEYAEVTISRTLFRGGGSEYSINNTPCRLLDIQELLSDTGMGRQMHVIVGQGQLDAVLAAGPDERRGFIEEAAGVLKHRRRKERALKKLDSMEANLVRVKDLVAELQRQLRPLARQAETARKAVVVQAELRDAKARLLADDVYQLQAKLQLATHDKTQLTQQLTETAQQVDEKQKALAEAENKALQATPRITELSNLWRELNTVHANLKTLSQVAAERLRAAQTPIAQPSVDLTDIERRAAEASAADSELLQQVEAAQAVLKTTVSQRIEAESQARSKQEGWKQLVSAQAVARERIARLQGEVRSAQQRVNAVEAEKARLSESITAAIQRLKDAESEVAKLPEVPVEQQSAAAQAHQQAGEDRDAARDEVDRLLRAERDAQAELATWVARRDTLAQSLTPEDETAQLLDKPQVRGTLSQYLKVAPGYENQVAVALNGLADAALVESWNTAVELAEAGVNAGAGTQRLVVAFANTGTEGPQVEAPALDGGAVWAPSVIKIVPAGKIEPALEAESALTHLLTRLLGDCIFCETLADAVTHLTHPMIKRAVTASGALITADGAISTGLGSATSIIKRQADFQYATQQAEQQQHAVAQLETQLQNARATYDAKIIEVNQKLKELRETDAQRAKLVEARAKATSVARAAAAELARLESTQAKLDANLETAKAAEIQAHANLTAGQQNHAETGETQLQTAQAEAETAEQAAVTARAAETQQRLQVRTLEEQSNRARDRARSLRGQLATAREQQRTYAREAAARQRRVHALQDVHLRVQAPLHCAEQALEQAAYELAQAQAEQSASNEQLTALRQAFENARQQLADLKELAHREELAQAQLQMRLEQLQEDALEAFSLSAAELVSQFGPQQLVEAEEPYPFDRAEQLARLEKAEKAFAKLGKINPLALEEYEALNTRHAFLQEQLRDLQQSKADLLQIVDEVDTRVEQVFTQAFADVQKSFEHVFATLFPGGKGRLSLTDPADMLNTGVEIEARPAGKKITRLSLLSGGERSLAAIALLVAIFKARPSPFYVMDEVEAALDDVNLSRLLEIFKELQQDSQLIIITHQKRTMQIADALYGVTMRDGVTQVVSSRLNEAS